MTHTHGLEINDRHLIRVFKAGENWGYIHLKKGVINNKGLLAPDIFKRIVTLQTPYTTPKSIPKQGFIWWLQDACPNNQLGHNLPAGSYQILGITGCACLVIPEYNAVAVRMYNQLSNQDGYNYLVDIREFGNQVNDILRVNSKMASNII